MVDAFLAFGLERSLPPKCRVIHKRRLHIARYTAPSSNNLDLSIRSFLLCFLFQIEELLPQAVKGLANDFALRKFLAFVKHVFVRGYCVFDFILD